MPTKKSPPKNLHPSVPRLDSFEVPPLIRLQCEVRTLQYKVVPWSVLPHRLSQATWRMNQPRTGRTEGSVAKITWGDNPLFSKSHHKEPTWGSQHKPSFATNAAWEGGTTQFITMIRSLLERPLRMGLWDPFRSWLTTYIDWDDPPSMNDHLKSMEGGKK